MQVKSDIQYGRGSTSENRFRIAAIASKASADTWRSRYSLDTTAPNSHATCHSNTVSDAESRSIKVGRLRPSNRLVRAQRIHEDVCVNGVHAAHREMEASRSNGERPSGGAQPSRVDPAVPHRRRRRSCELQPAPAYCRVGRAGDLAEEHRHDRLQENRYHDTCRAL